jgi:hypothetical protein
VTTRRIGGPQTTLDRLADTGTSNEARAVASMPAAATEAMAGVPDD